MSDDEGRAGDRGQRPPSMEEVLVQDDLDAAWRFFAAARVQPVPPAESDRLAAQGQGTTLDLSRFRARRMRQRLLTLLDELVAAIEQRDVQAVWDVLDESDACRCFPAGVREEALAIVRLPRASFRSPTRLYRYHHLLTELGDEPLEEPADPDQLRMSLPEAPASTEPTREIAFPGLPPKGGPDRRRSGWR